jgi:hypothetical protein
VAAGNIETDVDAEELLFIAIKAMKADRDEDAIACLKRAVEDMTQATALDPSLGNAALQLGLLHLITGDVQRARHVWAPLEALAEDDPLRLFKRGMEYFLDEHYDQTLAEIRRGMRAEASKRKSAVSEAPAVAVAPTPDSQHVLLAGYTKHASR